MLYLVEQCLNGLQVGMLLFLLAAALTGSFLFAAVLAIAATLVVGMAVEVVAMRRLYGRDHLDHVLGTFGLILFFNELVRLIWGPAGMTLPLPVWLIYPIEILPGLFYPL